MNVIVPWSLEVVFLGAIPLLQRVVVHCRHSGIGPGVSGEQGEKGGD